LVAVGLLAGPMAANALSFQSSFTNTIGNIPGAVTGRVLGLVDNTAGQAATSVIIDTYPPLQGHVSDPLNATRAPASRRGLCDPGEPHAQHVTGTGSRRDP